MIEEKNMLHSSKLNIFTEKQQDKDLSKYEEMIKKKNSQEEDSKTDELKSPQQTSQHSHDPQPITED